MKISSLSINQQLNRNRVFLALVFLLLLMPIAQAVHLTEHQILAPDYQCLVCHANNHFDNGDIHTPVLQLIDYQPVTLVQKDQGPFARFTTHHPDSIRAPPIAQ